MRYEATRYFIVFLTGFLVTYLLTPVARSLAWRFNVVDRPDERRPHRRATARGGGIAVVLGVHAACLVAIAFPGPNILDGISWGWWERFLLASGVLLVVGVIDDVRGLSPVIKLGGQALAAILITLTGVRFGTIMGIELPWYIDRVMVVIWILAVINAFNLIDGLDGLASGLAIISATGLCGVFLVNHLGGNILILIGLIGACLAFLRYNFNPASIFLGDTGSMFLGFTLGVISLQTFTKSTFFFSLSIPLLVLGVPIYDALLAIWRRSVRMWLAGPLGPDGKPRKRGIMQPDVEHLHHRLVKAGISTKRVALLLCLGNLVLVIFGLLITTFRWHAAGIFLIGLLGGAYILMRHLALIELRDTGTVILGGLRRPTQSSFKSLAQPVWDMLCMTGAVAVSMKFFETTPDDFWHQWFLDLPVWVTPTFSLLAISRIYVTVWSRARLRDMLKLVFILQLGLLVSLAIALLIDPYEEVQKWLIRTIVVGALSHPAMICSRAIYWLVEELVNWSRAQSEPNLKGPRVLLYGAGGRCWQFLKERSLKNLVTPTDGRRVVGIVDDEPSLRFQWVYGYQVLGGGKDLARVVEELNISAIIITAILTNESREAVKQLAMERGLQLTEWRCEEEVVKLSEARQSPPVGAELVK